MDDTMTTNGKPKRRQRPAWSWADVERAAAPRRPAQPKPSSAIEPPKIERPSIDSRHVDFMTLRWGVKDY